MCTGRRFTEMQLHIAVIKTLLRFRIRPVTEKLDMVQRFILLPSRPVAVRLERRSP